MEAALHKTVGRVAAPAPAPAVVPSRAEPALGPLRAVPAGHAQLQSLRVSSPSDPAEREATATAKQVLRMPARGASPAHGHAGLNLQGAGVAAPSLARHAGAIALMRQHTAQASALRVLARSAGSSTPAAGAQVPAGFASSSTGGAPLPLSVRNFMEPRFGADFSSVRIHTGDEAAQRNRAVSAQAFTVGRDIHFGAGRFQPDTDAGKELIAHELTHTIQQGAVAQSAGQVGAAAGQVQRSAEPSITQHTGPELQTLGLSTILNFFAERANAIPGFRMFTILLGVNPINMSRVERSAANILRAVVEFLPGGSLITEVLDRYGVFERVGGWIDQQLQSLGVSGSSIRNAINQFLDSLSWSDALSPGSVWERARRIFTDPIGRILSFARGLFGAILRFIQEAILRPIAALAAQSRGWDLLCAVLGRNPITGEAVPRTAETLIGGFMKLIGQEEIWHNIQRSNAIGRAWAWFQGALGGLLGFLRQIPQLFLQALQALELTDILLLPRAFAKVAGVFGDFIGRFIGWAGGTIWNLLEIIFEVVAPSLMVYLRRAGAAFRTILQNPIRFVGNLVRAGRLGFEQFASRFLTHLRAALIGWITGALSGANVYIPQALSFVEILKFVLSVLGLTWQNIRQKLVRAVGEPAVRVLETGFDIVVTLVTQGPAAAWQRIQESLANLREMVMEQIMTFVRDNIVQAAITRLLTALNPAGAFIQAILAAYNTVMFFVERLRQIAQVAAAMIDSIAAIASGVIAAAANRVEQTLAGLLTLAISFLARLVGLGRVSDVVTTLVQRIRQPVDRALDRVVDWIVMMARRLGRLVAQGASAVVAWWRARKSFRAGDGQTHTLLFRGEGAAARLMIRSDETPFSDFVARLRPGSDRTRIRHKAEAVRICAEIDRLRSAPATAAAGGANTINALLEELAIHTAPLLGFAIPNSSAPIFAGANSAGFGTRMQVRSLTNQNRREGSAPTSASNTAYAALNERRDSPGGASYYIKGHLLNQGLGGLGAWENLTPLSRSGNAQHETRAESIVKRSVDLPAIVEYEVSPNYAARGDKSSLLARISSSPEPPESKRVKSAIVEKEDFVPATLTIKANLLDEQLKIVSTILSATIVNAIDRRFDAYYLSSSPRPVAVNLWTSNAETIATLPGVSPQLAQQIVDAAKNLKKQGRERFGTYAELASLVPGVQPLVGMLEHAPHVRLY